MKITHALLVTSLLLNLGLAAVVISRAAKPAPPPPAPVAPVAKPAGKPAALTSITPETWAALYEGSDLDVLTRLRAEGFPGSIVRALAALKLRERFAERLAALSGGQHVPPYWRGQLYDGSSSPPRDPEARAKLRALNNEMAAAYQELFENEELGIDERLQAGRRRQYGDLPADKIRQIAAINKDYGELRSQVREETQGIVFPEDQARIDLIEQERRADLERTLTPEELEKYDLRTSPAAMQVRNQLVAFDPSEAEFLALYQVQREYDQRYKGQTLTADESREYRETMVAAVLSPERFADYQITTAGAYRDLSSLVKEYQLPTTAIGEVLGVQRDIARRAGTVRNDATLTTVQRDAQLGALAAEATTKLTATLGEEGFKNYRGRIGGWLQQLPPPVPAAPKP
jgi:hypothetical protein